VIARRFHYRARDVHGRSVIGSIDASNRHDALAHLRGRALLVSAVEPAATARGAMLSLGGSIRRRSDVRAAFFRSFAALIGAGIAVNRALEVLARDGRDARFRETVASIAADVSSGMPLSDAMQRHQNDFSRLAIAMIRAGEVGGSLDRSLRSVAEVEERTRTLRKRVGAALAYPAVVTSVALGLVAFLVGGTMPAFAAMFAQLHVALPPATAALIALGNAVRSPASWAVAALAVAAALAGAGAFARSQSRWAVALDAALLRIPLAGGILAKASAARFARTLGSLLSAGVELVAALQASTGVVSSKRYRHALAAVFEGLHRGEDLGSRLQATELFDHTFLALVRAGEESGSLDAMLLRLADYYEVDLEAALAAFTAVLEPALVCVLGGVVGTIVASILLPLYSLIGDIK